MQRVAGSNPAKHLPLTLAGVLLLIIGLGSFGSRAPETLETSNSDSGASERGPLNQFVEALPINQTHGFDPEQIAQTVSAQPFIAIQSGGSGSSQLAAIDCLTSAVYYEAGNEPIAGQRAVAQVVLNRVRHPAFPNSICGVVFEGSERASGCQFTFTCDGSLRRSPSPNGWVRARAVAIAALSGYVEPSVGHATHYHANYVMPYWAPSLAKLGPVASHIFYQWKGISGTPAAFSSRYLGAELMPSDAAKALSPNLLTYAYAPADLKWPGTQLATKEDISLAEKQSASYLDRSQAIAMTETSSGSGLAKSEQILPLSGMRLSDSNSPSRLIENKTSLIE